MIVLVAILVILLLIVLIILRRKRVFKCGFESIYCAVLGIVKENSDCNNDTARFRVLYGLSNAK